jgi:hypothetical protein
MLPGIPQTLTRMQQTRLELVHTSESKQSIEVGSRSRQALAMLADVVMKHCS